MIKRKSRGADTNFTFPDIYNVMLLIADYAIFPGQNIYSHTEKLIARSVVILDHAKKLGSK